MKRLIGVNFACFTIARARFYSQGYEKMSNIHALKRRRGSTHKTLMRITLDFEMQIFSKCKMSHGGQANNTPHTLNIRKLAGNRQAKEN